MRAYAYALGAIALWASLAALSTTLTDVPAFLLIGCALVVGSLCGLPWIREWKVTSKVLAIGLYGIFGFHFFLFLALRMAPPIEANLINYLWPLLVVVMSPLFLRGYRLTPLHLVGATLGFAGAFLIVTGGRLQVSPEYITGYVFAFGSAFIWASYSLLSKRVSFATGAIGLFCLVSGILSLLCHVFLEPAFTIQMQHVPALLALGVGPMGLAFFLWDKSLKEGDPRVIGSLSYLTPLLSTGLLIAVSGGEFTWATGIALLLIVAGATLGSWKR